MAQDDGVTVDSSSPPAKEYALPLASARDEATVGRKTSSGPSDRQATTTGRFGAGVTPGPEPAPAPTTTPTTPKQPKTHRHETTTAAPSTTTSTTTVAAAAPERGAPPPDPKAASDDGTSPGLALAAGGAIVVLAGGAAGLWLRRRAPGSPTT